MRQVPIKVAMVIPEMGLLEEPIKPTMREETVTKNAPKMITNNPNSSLLPTLAPGISVLGISAITAINTKLPIPTTLIDKSCSVRKVVVSALTPPDCLSEPILPLKEETIVGIVLISVINPPAATAPAPICRI